MKQLFYWLVLLTLMPVVAIRAQTTGGYVFELDGKPFTPPVHTTEGEEPVPGDVALVQGFKLCLDAPGKYSFTIKNGKLYRTLADGRSMVVACSIEEKAQDKPIGLATEPQAPATVLNPLADMDDEALRSLRGLTLRKWPDGIEKLLVKLDWEHVCLDVNAGVLWQWDEKMPPIPAEVRILVMDSGGNWQCTDMSGFSKLQNLRFLDLRDVRPKHFDFAVLKSLPLEYLILPSGPQVSHLEVLGSLSALKVLVANYCDYLGDARWLGQLQNLREFYAGQILAFDHRPLPGLELSALANLPKLTKFYVSGSKVASLPDAPMPKLKSAFLLFSNAPPKAIEAFVKANPQARIHKSMNEDLAEVLDGVDRICAKSIGVDIRNPEEVQTLRDTRDLTEVRELLKHFSVDETKNHGQCSCLGNVVFALYKGEDLVAVIGYHHGSALRWHYGTWPSDGILTGDSARYLAGWLAKYGYKDSRQLEKEKSQRRAEAERRQQERYAALLPPALDRSKLSTATEDDALAEFEKHFPAVETRAALYLKLFGCGQDPWEMASPLDKLLARVLLPYLPKEVLHEAIKSAPVRSGESLGALRWVFGEEHAKEWQYDQATFERLARLALNDPHPSNRWLTMAVLRNQKTPEALQVLRSVLKDGTKPSPKSKKADDEEYACERIYQPSAIKLPAGTPDKTVAALCLRMLQDKESATEVEKIYLHLNAETKKAWDEIVGQE
ncbi:hypothetical protein [Roseimicrobium sp. ORNL1]|uniref:hypothetical protein n=1 Tax=Roseimicrobium sp. ORNL1 TaxID=2711231 RepID=UPI0013E14A3E|nr:hypothetical protein [Roseimicrobium sp. ORNL1]QIF05549.1 hypothetical protein G5S37_29970 [Roseimicrobium sp. ORNL1]